MQRGTAIVLQAAILLFGLAVFAFLLWEPTVEGRNAHATLFQVYFNDPFLACAYAVSIAVFVALYRAFLFVGDAGQGRAASPRALRSLRIIRTCALILLAAIVVAEAWLAIAMQGQDDIAGGVAMGLLVALFSAALLLAAAWGERALRRRAVA